MQRVALDFVDVVRSDGRDRLASHVELSLNSKRSAYTSPASLARVLRNEVEFSPLLVRSQRREL